MSSAVVVTCILLFLVQDALCAPLWKVFCSGTPLFRGRVDPIISPGVVSNHLHKIAGANNFGPETTTATPLQVFNSMRASTCTTCSLQTVDNSAYWHPDLFYQWPNGTLSLVPTGGLTIYYEFRTGKTQTNPAWQAFPPGFRMVSGNPFRRSYNASSVADQAISFACLASSPLPEATSLNITQYNYCKDGLRMQVHFPQCWVGGTTVDSPSHSSHVAFPTAPDSGDCPAGFPVRLPSLFFEADYSVSAFPHGDGTRQPFVLACGDGTGFGFHGDFLNGWDQAIMQKAIEDSTCDSTNTNNGNDVAACDTLAPYIQSTPAGACNLAHDIPLNENFNLGYPSPSLPGCSPITYGPAAATPCTGAPTATYKPALASRFFIKSVSTGKYWRPIATGSQTIYANSSAQTYWEVFEATPMGGGNVALVNDESMQYTSASSTTAITCSKGSASSWETWTIVAQPNSEVAIISLRNSKYLCVNADESVGPTATSPSSTACLFVLVQPPGGTIA